MSITKYTEWKGKIGKYKIETFHGVVSIDDRELNFHDEFENKLTNIILELLKKSKN